MRDLSKRQFNQADIKEGFSFLDKEKYEAFPLTRWLDKSGHPIQEHPELPVEKAAEIKILSKRDPVSWIYWILQTWSDRKSTELKILSKEDPVPLDLLLRSNLVQQELSRMNINSRSLLNKTVHVTPQVMRMLRGLLEREVTRDDPEWAAAMTSLTVIEKILTKPSRRQNREKEKDFRTVVQQLVSSIPQSVLVRTSTKEKGQEIGIQKKIVTFEEPDKEWIEVESENPNKKICPGSRMLKEMIT